VAGLGLYRCSGLQPATRIPPGLLTACELGWGGIGIPPQPSHTETPTHIETRTHDQWGDTIEKSQAPDDGCINVRNMFSIEELK